jgi:hypothetical protein
MHNTIGSVVSVVVNIVRSHPMDIGFDSDIAHAFNPTFAHTKMPKAQPKKSGIITLLLVANDLRNESEKAYADTKAQYEQKKRKWEPIRLPLHCKDVSTTAFPLNPYWVQ